MSSSEIAFVHLGGDESLEILEVRGELDLTNVGTLEEEIVRTKARIVVLDLGFVVFLDSAGIRAIDLAYDRLAERHRTLLVVASRESRAGWTFRVAGFGDGLVIETLEAALAARLPAGAE